MIRKGGCVDDWTLEPKSPICVLAKAPLKNKNLGKQTIRPDYYLIGPINFPPIRNGVCTGIESML